MKKALALLLALVMVLSLVACGNEAAPAETAAPEADAPKVEETQGAEVAGKPFDDVVLNVLGNSSGVSETFLKYKDELYEEYGIILNYEQYTNEQLSNKLAVSLSAGSTDIDVMMIRTLDEGALFIENGWVEDLTPYINADPEAIGIDDFYPVTLELMQREDALYGLPTITESAVVFYNKTLFEKAGITELPTTMEELYATAALLDDPANNVCGFVCRGAGNPAVTQWSCFLRAFGGDFFDAEGNAAINTPEAVEAFEFYGKLLRDYGPDGVLNMGQPDTWNLFMQGQAAMRLDCNSNMGLWNPDNAAISLEEIGFFQIPVGPNGNYGDFSIVAQSMCMNSASEKKEAAWTFMCWALSKEMQTEMQKAGNSSPRASAWEAGVSSWPIELQEVTAAATAAAVPTDRPLMTNVALARDIIGEVIVAAIEGEVDIQEFANEKNEEFQELIDSEK